MNQYLLEIKNLSKTFFKNGHTVAALKDVSLEMNFGEILGIIGESGSGKSTIANIVTSLETADRGQILFKGRDITHPERKLKKTLYHDMQMVFQDPVGSFNPHHTIGSSIGEALCNLCGIEEAKRRKEEIRRLLTLVGLKPEYALSYPHELSGGECQRAAIVRAVASHPDLLICDEATSALDVSAQAQIIETLLSLRSEMKMGILFISHDLPLVSCFCDRVCIMKDGEVVEYGQTLPIVKNPQNAYTKRLLDSVLTV